MPEEIEKFQNLGAQAQEDYLIEKVLTWIEDLPPRQWEILIRRFGLTGKEETLTEVAEKFKLSRERIRQLQVAGIETLTLRLQQLLRETE